MELENISGSPKRGVPSEEVRGYIIRKAAFEKGPQCTKYNKTQIKRLWCPEEEEEYEEPVSTGESKLERVYLDKM